MTSNELYDVMEFYLENEYKPAILNAYAIKRKSDEVFYARYGSAEFEIGGANTKADFLMWHIKRTKAFTANAISACHNVAINEVDGSDTKGLIKDAMHYIDECRYELHDLIDETFSVFLDIHKIYWKFTPC